MTSVLGTGSRTLSMAGDACWKLQHGSVAGSSQSFHLCSAYPEHAKVRNEAVGAVIENGHDFAARCADLGLLQARRQPSTVEEQCLQGRPAQREPPQRVQMAKTCALHWNLALSLAVT